jgi:NTP pyrophosphatase (non-canonical NTP hydrolase)
MAKSLEEYLLDCLAEEAGEVTQMAMKCARFGFDDRWPDKRTGSNREELKIEILQLVAVAEMLGIIDNRNFFSESDVLDNKKKKVEKYYDYSRQRGRLEYASEF